MRQRIDLTFGVGRRTERFAIVEVGPAIPAPVPGLPFDVVGELGGFGSTLLDKWIVDTDDKGRRMETLEELKAADPRFVPALDWRPPPGTPEFAEAEKLREEWKKNPQPLTDDQPKKKRKKAE